MTKLKRNTFAKPAISPRFICTENCLWRVFFLLMQMARPDIHYLRKKILVFR